VKITPTKNDSVWHSKVFEEQSKAIHEPNGLLASWYFALRAAEEAARSERYQRPLTLILVEALPPQRRALEAWIADQMRGTDLLCQGHPGEYFMLLPETDEASSWEVSQRLLSQNPGVSLSVATLSADDARFDALLYRLDPPDRHQRMDLAA
jgi:hypothetical protein